MTKFKYENSSLQSRSPIHYNILVDGNNIYTPYTNISNPKQQKHSLLSGILCITLQQHVDRTKQKYKRGHSYTMAGVQMSFYSKKGTYSYPKYLCKVIYILNWKIYLKIICKIVVLLKLHKQYE